MKRLLAIALLAILLAPGCTGSVETPGEGESPQTTAPSPPSTPVQPPESEPLPAPTPEPETAEPAPTPAPVPEPSPATTPEPVATGKIPLYPGVTEAEVPDDLRQDLNIDADLDCRGYVVKASPSDILNWYKEQMVEWIPDSEESFSPPDKPEVTIGLQHYNKDMEGAFVFAHSNFAMGKTLLVIASGPWQLIQNCGFQGFEPNGGPPGEKEYPPEPEKAEEIEEAESIDWSEAQVFEDPEGDFWLGDGSPPEIIEFPPSDIVKVMMANDSQYLYLKFEMNGEIPTLPLGYEDDNVRWLVMDFLMDTDQNGGTGKAMNYPGADLAFDISFGSPQKAGGEFYQFVHYAFYDASAPEGISEWRSGTLLAGGVGEYYVTVRFPLAKLNLESGAAVDILAFVEAESDLYHHFARDVVGKDGQWYSNIKIR